jgi:hypothetical protein
LVIDRNATTARMVARKIALVATVPSAQVGSGCQNGYGIGVAVGASARHGATGEFDDKRGAAWHLMVLPGAGAAWIARKPFQR